MTQLIIYLQDNNIPAIVCPSEDALQKYGLMAIAIKDVPAGKPFKIVDSSELPFDFPQAAWSVVESDLTDGIGGENDFFVQG